MSALTAVLAAALSLALTPLMMWIAPRIGAVAGGGGRHVHERPTPTAAGLAIVVAVWVPTLIANYPLSGPLLGMFLGTLVLVPICFIDDIKDLPAIPRLLGHFVVAVVAFAWGVRIDGITNPLSLFGEYQYLPLGWLAGPVTVLWIVIIINALNWIDGLDGLAAGVAAIAAGALAVISWTGNNTGVALPALAISVACLGFLPYNFNPAKVFMGDTGAMFLGFMLACLSVLGVSKYPAALAVFAPLLVLGVPIYDSVTTVFKRVRQGKSPYASDKQHFHHRLLDRGLSTRQAVLVIYGLSALLGGAAILLWVQS